MLRIRKVLKLPFEGLTAPEEALSMRQAMHNAYELNYGIRFTYQHYQRKDQKLHAEYFNSDQVSVALKSYAHDQLYILETFFEDQKLENITYEFIDKYIDAYTLEDLLDKAQQELEQGTNRWVAILMQASYQGSKGMDLRIVEVLQKALSHPDYLIRRGACWIAFDNEDYWEVMLPILRKVQTEDPHEEVRSNAEGVIECMFWEEREEEERQEAIRKQIEENQQKPLWSDS